MREYNRNGKPVIHSTDLYNFSICPKMSQLGREQEIEINDSMWKGLLLESYVFGFKEDQETLELYGTKKNKTGEYPAARIEMLEAIRKEAELVKSYLPENAEGFKRIEVENEDYILTGEIDGFTPEIFYDVKRTKNFDYWNRKSGFMDFFQAFYYPFLWSKLGNPTPQFKYVVYSSDLNLVKSYTVKNPEKQFNRVAALIDRYTNEPFFDANILTCQNTGYGTCNYLQWCKEGKEIISGEALIVEENLL